MAFSALRFIGLTIFAVALGVLSAAVSFGGDRALFSGPFLAPSNLLDSVAGTSASEDETARRLRHIMERQ